MQLYINFAVMWTSVFMEKGKDGKVIKVKEIWTDGIQIWSLNKMKNVHAFEKGTKQISMEMSPLATKQPKSRLTNLLLEG